MDISVVFLIYITGLVLLFLELFAPGVMMAFLGVSLVIIGVVLAFWHHPPIYGTSLLGIAIVLVPSVLLWVLKKITLSTSQNLEDGYTSTEDKFDTLAGQDGVTLTPLRPSGMAVIAGRRVDVTSETAMIEKDTPVKVVKVEGSRIVVRATGPAKTAEEIL